jgi:hypothetical protein
MSSGIAFTKHALERMAERGASREFILSVVSKNVSVLRQKSKSQPDLDILTSRDNRKMAWSVIYSENSSVVVTVRRASKQEEALYDEKNK